MAEKDPRSGTLTVNRKAFFDYEVLKRYEAGIMLTGTEIKSIRAGKINIRDAYAREEKGEMWLFNAHIAPYENASVQNHDPERPRKLLLHRVQIEELAEQTQQRGQTVVVLSMFLKRGMAKVELGVARGKKSFDKRQTIAEREAGRDIARAMRHNDR